LRFGSSGGGGECDYAALIARFGSTTLNAEKPGTACAAIGPAEDKMDEKISSELSPSLLRRDDTVLVVIDVQERLLPVMEGREKLVENLLRLIRVARIIGLPVVVTEQQNLGGTVAEVKEELTFFDPISKIEFDCFKRTEFVAKLRDLGKKTLVLTGIEAHICVCQTALHALPDFNVHVVADAVSSRTADNRRIALDRMRQQGATVSSTEMVIYELLERAGTEEFRQTLKLVK
jgi:nicotinamidase-related amidase